MFPRGHACYQGCVHTSWGVCVLPGGCACFSGVHASQGTFMLPGGMHARGWGHA